MDYMYPDWRKKVRYSPSGPVPQILMEDSGFKVVLGGLEPGQAIPLHPEGASVFHFLEGTGWMLIENQRIAIQPGATVVAPKGARRGIQAESRLAFLAARAE